MAVFNSYPAKCRFSKEKYLASVFVKILWDASLESCYYGTIAPTFIKEIRQIAMAMLGRGENNLIIDPSSLGKRSGKVHLK